MGTVEVAYAGTYNVGENSYSTNGTATKIESVADNDFLNFNCVTTYASGKKVTEKFSAFLRTSGPYYTIPGLRTTNVLGKVCDSMVPQSICKMGDYIIIGAYDYDEEYNSVMYVMTKTGTLKATIVMPNKSHMGAMAYDGVTLWVGDTINDRMIGYTMKQIEDSIYYTYMLGAKSVKIDISDCKKIKLITNPSYATYYDGKLWVGEFEKSSSTKTPYIYSYVLKYNGDEYVNSYVYNRIEAPKETQGITFYKDTAMFKLYLIVSQSFGRNKESKLIVYIPTNYNNPKAVSSYYQIYKGDRIKDITMPNMSEGVCLDASSMYMLFESGAKEYSYKKNIWTDVANTITDCFCKLDVRKICVS